MKNRYYRFLVALAIFGGALSFAARDSYPPLPNPLRLEAVFNPGSARRPAPILTSGAANAGDFLYVRYLDAKTLVFSYDSWGVGGPTSRPVSFSPGGTHRLVIDTSPFNQLSDRAIPKSHRLRVSYDDVTVLDAGVSVHAREADRIFIGSDPIGGTVCDAAFGGTLKNEDGLVFQGFPARLFSWRERIANLWAEDRWRFWPLLVLSLAVTWGGDKLARALAANRRESRLRWRTAIEPHALFLVCAAVSAIIFAWFVTDGTFQFNYPESFGSFYDFQARSLLHGRLDVPPEAISGEAFLVQGKYYGYFGPTPALLRIPFVALDLMAGNLSRGFMVFDYLVCLGASYLILRQAARQTRRTSLLTPAAVAFFTVNVGLGSTLFFLSSRAYVYHEAILCGCACGLVSCYFSVRYLAEPERRWWVGALIGGLLSVQARPSSGLFVLSFAGCAAVANFVRSAARRQTPAKAGDRITPRSSCRHLFVGAGCGLAILSFNGASYLKFKTFDGSPFKYHVQFDAVRLHRIGNRNFHLANLRFNFDAYLARLTFEFRRQFPFVFYTGRNSVGFRGMANDIAYYPDSQRAAFGGVQMDVIEPMLGPPLAMSGLCLLAMVATGAATIRPGLHRLFASLWLGVLPLALALFTAICTAHRFTADFCPFLITAAAFGPIALADGPGRKWMFAALSVTTLWSVGVTLALTIHYQRVEVWGVPDEARASYQRFAHWIDQGIGRDVP
jgi:hypothetical protein